MDAQVKALQTAHRGAVGAEKEELAVELATAKAKLDKIKKAEGAKIAYDKAAKDLEKAFEAQHKAEQAKVTAELEAQAEARQASISAHAEGDQSHHREDVIAGSSRVDASCSVADASGTAAKASSTAPFSSVLDSHAAPWHHAPSAIEMLLANHPLPEAQRAEDAAGEHAETLNPRQLLMLLTRGGVRPVAHEMVAETAAGEHAETLNPRQLLMLLTRGEVRPVAHEMVAEAAPLPTFTAEFFEELEARANLLGQERQKSDSADSED